MGSDDEELGRGGAMMLKTVGGGMEATGSQSSWRMREWEGRIPNNNNYHGNPSIVFGSLVRRRTVCTRSPDSAS